MYNVSHLREILGIHNGCFADSSIKTTDFFKITKVESTVAKAFRGSEKIESTYTGLNWNYTDIGPCIIYLDFIQILALCVDYQDKRPKPGTIKEAFDWKCDLHDPHNVFMEELKHRIKEISKKKDDHKLISKEIEMLIKYLQQIKDQNIFPKGGGPGPHMEGVLPDIIGILQTAKSTVDSEMKENPFPKLVKELRRETQAIMINLLVYLLRILRDNNKINRAMAHINQFRNPTGDVNQMLANSASGLLLAEMAYSPICQITHPEARSDEQLTLTAKNERLYKEAIQSNNLFLQMHTRTELQGKEEAKDEHTYTRRYDVNRIEVSDNISRVPLDLTCSNSGIEPYFRKQVRMLNIFFELHGLWQELGRNLLFIESGDILASEMGDAQIRANLYRQAYTMGQCHHNVLSKILGLLTELNSDAQRAYAAGTNDRSVRRNGESVEVSSEWKDNCRFANTIFIALEPKLRGLIQVTETMKKIAEEGLSPEKAMEIMRKLSFFIDTAEFFAENYNIQTPDSIKRRARGTAGPRQLQLLEQLDLRKLAQIASLGILILQLPHNVDFALCHKLGINPKNPSKKHLLVDVFQNPTKLLKYRDVLIKLIDEHKGSINLNNYAFKVVYFYVMETALADKSIDGQKRSELTAKFNEHKREFARSITKEFIAQLPPAHAFLIGLGLIQCGEEGKLVINDIYAALNEIIKRLTAEYRELERKNIQSPNTRIEELQNKDREIAQAFLYLCLLDTQQQHIKFGTLYTIKNHVDIFTEFHDILYNMGIQDEDCDTFTQRLSEYVYSTFDGGQAQAIINSLLQRHDPIPAPAHPSTLRTPADNASSAKKALAINNIADINFLHERYKLLAFYKKKDRLSDAGYTQWEQLDIFFRLPHVKAAIESAKKHRIPVSPNPEEPGMPAGHAQSIDGLLKPETLTGQMLENIEDGVGAINNAINKPAAKPSAKPSAGALNTDNRLKPSEQQLKPPAVKAPAEQPVQVAPASSSTSSTSASANSVAATTLSVVATTHGSRVVDSGSSAAAPAGNSSNGQPAAERPPYTVIAPAASAKPKPPENKGGFFSSIFDGLASLGSPSKTPNSPLPAPVKPISNAAQPVVLLPIENGRITCFAEGHAEYKRLLENYLPKKFSLVICNSGREKESFFDSMALLLNIEFNTTEYNCKMLRAMCKQFLLEREGEIGTGALVTKMFNSDMDYYAKYKKYIVCTEGDLTSEESHNFIEGAATREGLMICNMLRLKKHKDLKIHLLRIEGEAIIENIKSVLITSYNVSEALGIDYNDPTILHLLFFNEQFVPIKQNKPLSATNSSNNVPNNGKESPPDKARRTGSSSPVIDPHARIEKATSFNDDTVGEQPPSPTVLAQLREAILAGGAGRDGNGQIPLTVAAPLRIKTSFSAANTGTSSPSPGVISRMQSGSSDLIGSQTNSSGNVAADDSDAGGSLLVRKRAPTAAKPPAAKPAAADGTSTGETRTDPSTAPIRP